MGPQPIQIASKENLVRDAHAGRMLCENPDSDGEFASSINTRF